MHLKPFELFHPASLPEVLDLLGRYEEGVKLIAGGTDLLVQMKQGLIRPARLINLLPLNDLKGIGTTEKGLRTGPYPDMRTSNALLFSEGGGNCSPGPATKSAHLRFATWGRLVATSVTPPLLRIQPQDCSSSKRRSISPASEGRDGFPWRPSSRDLARRFFKKASFSRR